jgi:hypothetical protein
MSSIERELIAKAKALFGRIAPCTGKTFTQCFLVQDGKLQFWFNDSSGNTHLLYIEQKALTGSN